MLQPVSFHRPNLRQKGGRGQRGKRFEEELLYAGEIYRMRGLGYLDRHEVPMGVNASGQRFYKEKTGFDFTGGEVVDVGGKKLMRVVAIEAKEINEDRLRIRRPKLRGRSSGSGVKAHQLEALCALQVMGARCLILWKRHGEVWAIDPEELRKAVPVGGSLLFERWRDSRLLMPVRCLGPGWDYLGKVGGLVIHNGKGLK